jgi:uncharacterized membrane protein
MKNVGKILLVVLSILYPCIVFAGLFFWGTPPRILGLCVAVVVALNFLTATDKSNDSGNPPFSKYLATGCLGLLVIAIFVTNSERLLKIYPVVMNVTLLVTFGATLFRSPSMILRFASLQDKTVVDDPSVVLYCRKVTAVWCCFFIFNIGVSLYTVFFASNLVWSLYNGLISYILIGILFVGEKVVRHFVQKK